MVGFRPHVRRFQLPFGALLLGALVAVAVLSPSLHHDVVCHLQSPTHCTTCLISSAAEDPSEIEALSGSPLVAIGSVSFALEFTPEIGLPREWSGRSPPVRD